MHGSGCPGLGGPRFRQLGVEWGTVSCAYAVMHNERKTFMFVFVCVCLLLFAFVSLILFSCSVVKNGSSTR